MIEAFSSDPARRWGRAVPARLAAYYSALFLLMGLQLPFWPVWLASRGMGPAEIGTLVAIGLVAKVLINPAVAHVADRTGARRQTMIALALIGLAGYVLFALVSGFAALAAVTVLAFGAIGALGPLGENVTLLAAREGRFAYGRVRLWGSLTFIAGAMGGGWLLADASASIILWCVIAGAVLILGACFLLPDVRVAVGQAKQPSAGADISKGDAPQGAAKPTTPLRRLMGDRGFLLMLLAASLVQTSHAVYYGFATLHWQAAGLSSSLIGALWALGVLAEVILFAAGAAVLQRIGPVPLLLLAGLAGVLRWTVTALTTALPALLVVQCLHAFTFGAAHLAAMTFIARTVPASESASAQSLYSSIVMGVAAGIVIPLAGVLFGAAGGAAYFAMAALCAGGAIVAAIMTRRT